MTAAPGTSTADTSTADRPAAETLVDRLGAVARERPDAAAIVLPHRRGTRLRVTTFAELDRRSDAAAAGLAAAGIGAGVRTAFLVPPGEDFFVVAFALLKAAAVPVLVDPGIGLRRLGRCLAQVRPEAFVGVPRAQLARRALGWAPTAERLVTVGARVPGGGPTLKAVERAGARLSPVQAAPRPAGAVAAIAFTSGGTGVPKGVQYTDRQFLAQLDLLRELYRLEPGEVSLATFPPFALFGPPLGLTTVVPRMDFTRPARVHGLVIVDTANRAGATVMFGSPALLDTVSRWGEARAARMPTLRRVLSAGAPVSPVVQRRMLGLLGHDAEIHTPYGATEALPVTTISSTEILSLVEQGRQGICVGRPVPGVDLTLIRISNEPVTRLTDADRVPDGEVGEVVVRGPNVTPGYAERPDATALASIDWDGRRAHRMGDLGSLDSDGRLWFCGRKVHRVTTPAGTMFPVPCEQRINAHPAVVRSALVGVGPAGAQRPVVCVELEQGQRPSPALSASILALAAADPVTEPIGTVLFPPRFPVDIRHNAKIDRTALAAWAAKRLR